MSIGGAVSRAVAGTLPARAARSYTPRCVGRSCKEPLGDPRLAAAWSPISSTLKWRRVLSPLHRRVDSHWCAPGVDAVRVTPQARQHPEQRTARLFISLHHILRLDRLGIAAFWPVRPRCQNAVTL